MTKLTRFGLLTLVLATLASAGTGCVVRGSGHLRIAGPVVVVEEPPPPRVVVVTLRPGFIFIEGRWTRRGNQWHWQDGHWQRERAGHIWVAGRWERRGNGHVWVDGRWQSGGNRDHRGQGGGVTTRDHRN